MLAAQRAHARAPPAACHLGWQLSLSLRRSPPPRGRFSCPGFYDDDHFKRCSYKADEAERIPWKDE